MIKNIKLFLLTLFIAIQWVYLFVGSMCMRPFVEEWKIVTPVGKIIFAVILFIWLIFFFFRIRAISLHGWTGFFKPMNPPDDVRKN